ncbi:TetR/AcrR family transcriptional regulator [Cystobacter ferrugineus]|uniref:TetR family transcriptional regulator n=1 Tax=Cystobacter ferrugineus TaxID=83449 RepID=A0A1L9AXY7_9BACT|nr:TetR/AcrR family transcriptional regulator [Cystobacter ferrugineus]OJH34867.1 TetR family transcriptional regulator [Cystobacter ferrugineus]
MSDSFLPIDDAPPARRTQQERRDSTRQKLLDATVECLVELGYARTTTIAVAQRAEVSHGALFKHFPTKAALLAAAVERLFPRLIARYRAELADLPAAPEDRIAEAIERLWFIYQRPELLAAIELYVAARTDAELAAALSVVDPPHRRHLHHVARELFPEVADAHPGFDSLVELILNAVQGAAVGGAALPPNPDHRGMLTLLVQLSRRAFSAPA